MASRWSEDALGSAWPPLLAALLTSSGYRLGWLLGFPHNDGPWAFWASNALLFCALLVVERRRWPAMLLAAPLGELLAAASMGLGWYQPLSMSMAALNTAQAAISAAALRQIWSPDLIDARRVALVFISGCVLTIPALTSGAAALLAAQLAAHPDPLRFWLTLFAGDALGMLLIVPPLASWLVLLHQARRGAPLWPPELRGVLALLCSVVLAMLIFHDRGASLSISVAPYLLAALLTSAALLMPLRWSALCVLVVALVAVQATIHGTGPFSGIAFDHNTRISYLQLYLASVATSSLVISAITREHALAARAYEEAERRFQQARGAEHIAQIAAGVAHDMNNLLSAATLSLDLMREERPELYEADENFRDAALATQRAASLTSQLLHAARPASPARQRLALDPLLAALYPILAALGRGRLQITLQLDARDAAIDASADQLERVLLNLVGNAREVISGHGKLTITTTRADDAATIIVHDSGPGLPADAIPRLFEPFFTTRQQGTGLGLYVCHQIITQHGGAIHADNHPAGGACFTITLPLAAEL